MAGASTSFRDFGFWWNLVSEVFNGFIATILSELILNRIRFILVDASFIQYCAMFVLRAELLQCSILFYLVLE
jgi:hypothetical protein